jgi:hypothetical protein
MAIKGFLRLRPGRSMEKRASSEQGEIPRLRLGVLPLVIELSNESDQERGDAVAVGGAAAEVCES